MGNFEYGTLIILDIGKNTSAKDEKETKTFFQQARECATKIIERNIMLQSKNLVGIILMGSSNTKNSLSDQCPGTFKHIELFSELKVPTWDMIDSLPEESTNRKGDWYEALIVAAQYFTEVFSGAKVQSRKIVLMTNFKYKARISGNIDDVVAGFKQENFEIFVLGPELENIDSEDIELIQRFIQETEGDQATFDEAMRGWIFHKKKTNKITPQNFDLGIGPNIKIPVSIYIKTEDKPVLKNWQKSIKDPISLQSSTTEAYKSERKIMNTENQTVISIEDTIEGYQYGQQIVPFSDSDKAMLYKSGERSLILYGFTPAENVQWQYFCGEGTYYMHGRKGNANAQKTIRCLAACLLELNMVGVTRKIHVKNTQPKMFAVMPVVDPIAGLCLSCVNLCYKDQIKNMGFPSTELKKYNCTKEQVDTFKQLINAMDLTKAYDDSYNDAEAFPVAETVSPYVQYVLDCVAFRAKNPGKPLPQPRDEIMALFKVPPLVEKRSRDIIEKLKKQFTLTKIEAKKKSKTKPNVDSYDDLQNQQAKDNVTDSNNVTKITLPDMKSTQDDINNIGTVNPVQDFQILLNKGKLLKDLYAEITDVIENLVYASLGDYTKALKTVKAFRDECVKQDPTPYNEWLQKFKRSLIERKKETIVNLFTEKQLNVIIKEENEKSLFAVVETDDSQMYECDTIPNSTELTISSEVNDMFDDL